MSGVVLRRVAAWTALAVLALVAGAGRRIDALDFTTSLIVGLQPGTTGAELGRAAEEAGARLVSRNEPLNMATLETRSGKARAALAALRRNPAVRYATPNVAVFATAAPSDEYYTQGMQWNIDRVKAPEAWNLLPPGGNTPVAVLDTGIDYDHPEFAGRIDTAAGCDQFHGDCLGSGGGTRARDDNGHGTHVAGIIGANTNNRTGIASVSGGRVTIIPIKVLSRGGGGYISDVFDAVAYAVNKGAKVINMSLGLPCGTLPRALTDAWRDAIVYAEQRDVLIVMAAGNDGGCWEGNPFSGDSRIISVAATDIADGSPAWTSRGAWVTVAAPGDRILSTVPVARGSYATYRGTSMATPHVAAQAALLFQVPGATRAKVIEWIKSTCDSANVSVQCGGRINVYRSVHLAVKGVDPVKAPPASPEQPVTAAATSASATSGTPTPAPALPAGRFAPPALPPGLVVSETTRTATVPAPVPGNAANVAWSGVFWPSAPIVTVGLCEVDDVGTRTALDAAFHRLSDASTSRGLGWRVERHDSACDTAFRQPRVLITRGSTGTAHDSASVTTAFSDSTGTVCAVSTPCWVSVATITIDAATFDRLPSQQQEVALLRELARALGLGESMACEGSIMVTAERCPDIEPTDLGPDDLASLNELLAMTLKALQG